MFKETMGQISPYQIPALGTGSEVLSKPNPKRSSSRHTQKIAKARYTFRE